MPIISFATGYMYLIFGSFKVFKNIGISTMESYTFSLILTIFMFLHIERIARSTFGNVICPRSFALQMVLTHFSMIIVIIVIVGIVWIAPSTITQIVSFLLFAFFGYLLNIGPGTFPTFSVADPFYWNQNRAISPSYDRAFKTVMLCGISFSFVGFLTICSLKYYHRRTLIFFWYSIASSCLIMFDVILMAHYWEIFGPDDPGEEPRIDHVDNLHMD